MEGSRTRNKTAGAARKRAEAFNVGGTCLRVCIEWGTCSGEVRGGRKKTGRKKEEEEEELKREGGLVTAKRREKNNTIGRGKRMAEGGNNKPGERWLLYV